MAETQQVDVEPLHAEADLVQRLGDAGVDARAGGRNAGLEIAVANLDQRREELVLEIVVAGNMTVAGNRPIFSEARVLMSGGRADAAGPGRD
ncbi:MAG: hypothetical protein WDM96_19185 [Lacunisphaera sp.]